jgi:hypothetical protein
VVNLDDGSGHAVKGVFAEYCGSAVLGTTETEENNISDIIAHQIHDNGVYLSSGFKNRVVGVKAKNVNSSGVKARGSQNHISGCVLDLCNVGITVTGNGTVLDSYGANGAGTTVIGNKVSNSESYGIQVGGQDGHLMRDVKIVSNVIENHTGTSGFAPFVGSVVKGIDFSNNTVDGFLSDYGLIVSGSSGNEIVGCVIQGNTFADGTEALRLLYVDKSTISGNVMYDLSSTIVAELRYSDENILSGNYASSNKTIRANASYGCVGNFLINNMAKISADGSVNVAHGNYTQPLPDPSTDTPIYIGQFTVSGGVAYIATGTSSTSDWKQTTP